ncbi:MAG: ATP-binding protein [Clostridiales bacterium]|nr:ATP-binding protein [Clostridiales bacterium]
MRIAVLSGKGGTGKTTISTNLAYIMNVNYVDLDVEEPNGHIFLKPQIEVVKDVVIPTPRINAEKCTLCGICANTCQFNALINTGKKIMVFEDLCHGCGACSLACPEDAITEYNRKIGDLSIGTYDKAKFYSGKMLINEPMAGPIITDIKKSLPKDESFIIDCSPGTSCNVVKALDGADYALMVTEPSKFGLHDLKLAVELVEELKIPLGIVINRANEYDHLIEDFAKEENIDIIGKIPFSKEAARMYSEGKLLIEDDEIRKIFEVIKISILDVVKEGQYATSDS